MTWKSVVTGVLLLFLLPVAGAATYTYQLEPGWNLVSAPFPGVGKQEINDSCAWQGGPWWWDPAAGDGGDWSFHDVMEPEKGYWVKVAGPCTVPVEGEVEAYQPQDLRPGWNLVSSLRGQINKSRIAHACAWQGGPWWWNHTVGADGDWSFHEVMNPGKGYWVKVEETCVIADKPVDAAAEWTFLVAADGDERIQGILEAGNLDLAAVPGINRIDRYKLEIDIGADGDFSNRQSFGIAPKNYEGTTFEPVFEDMASTDADVGDRLRFPITGWDTVQPWDEPVQLRLTITKPMLIPYGYGDRDAYRFIASGSSKTFPVGDKNTGCRETNTGVFSCKDLGITTDAEFSCGDAYEVGVSNVDPDADEVKLFFDPTTTWKTIAAGSSKTFADAEGTALFDVAVEQTGVERGWEITTFTVTCH